MEIPKPLNTHLIIAIIVGLIEFGITWRLVPHLPNFAPIGAIALLIGRAFGWKQSLLAVLTIMAVSDLLLGGYAGMEWTWLGLGLIAGATGPTRTSPKSSTRR